MVSRNRKIARRIGQAVANDVLDISGAISAGAGVTVYATADDLPTTGLTAGDEAFVSGSNRLYISNGTGWYSIGLVNTNPAITSVEDPSSNTTPFTLATDGSALVLTITAADPEDIPLTYSYAVTTGSLTNGGGTTATVVQGTGANTNQFTITPTTTEAYAGTFELTFTTSDGINQASSVNSFTLSFITTIANSNYTTLLATAIGTSDNNNITDASSNNHSITVSGDIYAGAFSPFRWNGASQYYDGSSYQVYGGWSDITGLSNVTIECWIYKTSHTNSYHSIMATRASGSNSSGFDMRFPQNSGVLTVYYTGGAGVSSTTNMNLNTWYHVMFVRDGSTGTLYIDGVQEDQDTSWGNRPGLSNLYVGTYARGNVLLDGCINGYISDLRISNISRTAEVPEAPINVDSNTLFYVAGKHGPYDTSSSYYSPSFTGLSGANLTKSTYGPYEAPNSGYTITDHGGSINFDGTGDYLTIPDHSSLNFASNDWTIECWIYPRSNVGDCGIWHQSASGGLDWFGIYLDGAFNPKFVLKNNNAEEWAGTAAANTAPQNTWTHIALVRRFGTDIKMYANGKVVHTETQHLNVALEDKSYNHVIGYERFVGNGTYFDGMISDFKIDIGTAHYTAEFTPPTAPLSSSGTSLHIKGTDASIIDKSQSTNLKLFGNTTGSTTQVKFSNTKSMYFDGTGDYITNLPDDLFAFGYDPYTVEFWIYTSSYPVYSSRYHIFGSSTSAGNTYAVKLGGGQIDSGNSNGDTNTMSSTAYANMPAAGNWVHVAFVRTGIYSNQCKCYINGTQGGQETDNKEWGTATDNTIGATASGNYGFNGYIQDLRVTKGLARYTSNFTPPTASLEG